MSLPRGLAGNGRVARFPAMPRGQYLVLDVAPPAAGLVAGGLDQLLERLEILLHAPVVEPTMLPTDSFMPSGS